MNSYEQGVLQLRKACQNSTTGLFDETLPLVGDQLFLSSDLLSVCYSGRLQQREDLQPSSSESSQSDLYERYVYSYYVRL